MKEVTHGKEHAACEELQVLQGSQNVNCEVERERIKTGSGLVQTNQTIYFTSLARSNNNMLAFSVSSTAH